MRPSVSLKKHRAEVERILQKYPMLSNVRVFGSVARGEDTEDSDLDLFVDIAPGTSLFKLGGFREDMVEILGNQVDIIISGAKIHEIMARKMAREMKPLYNIMKEKIKYNASQL